MRITYEHELEELNKCLRDMAMMVEKAIEQTFVAFEDQNYTMAEDVIKGDRNVNDMERAIESRCLSLILRQQPVARDLRVISSALKMISDMERIGDQASDIVELAQYIKKSDVKYKIHLSDMANEVIKMVTKSIKSFVKKDIEMARNVIVYDDVVDNYFEEIKKELIRIISSGESDGEEFIDILMIAKYLERIGDHATNIAEWVEYSILGYHAE